jgi:hypothetical protein
MTEVRLIADEREANLCLRSLWTELDIRDIEEQGASQPKDNKALESVYDARKILDLEPPLIRTPGC